MSRGALLLLAMCLGSFAQTPTGIKLPDGVELYGTMPVGSQTKFWLQLKALLMQWDIRSNPPFQRSVAFLVGVSDYGTLRKLPGVDNDLNRMRDYLLNKGGFDQVYIARGAAATPKIVQKYMINVFHDSLGSEDRLLFYYSGHGDDPGGFQPHLQFAGFRSWEDVDQILRVDTYETWSRRLPVKHALFMFDACLAGIVTSPKADDRAEQHRQLLESMSGNGSRVVVTAGTGDQKAWYVEEKGKGRSLFTQFFLTALESGSADKDGLGFMTIKQVVAETQTMAANFARGRPGETVLPQDQPFETLGRDGGRNQNRKGTFVFLNSAIKTPNLPPDLKRTMNLSPKGGGLESDREFGDKEAYEHWIYIKDKNSEQLFQEHIRRFPQSHFLTLATFEIERIRKGSPVTGTPKLPERVVESSQDLPPALGGDKRVNPKDGLTYVWIPPGHFTMGCSPGDQQCYDDEKPAHEVTITKGFRLGVTEVTQAAFRQVLKSDPSNFKGDDLPVENITWDEARQYCTAVGGRLPTEAEWEYAARAGSPGSRYGSLDGVAWYDGNSENKTHTVARKTPNAWGLYDMLGNVWEWTGDWYGAYQKGAISDPQGPQGGQQRMLRGGSWSDGGRGSRVSGRFSYVPSIRFSYIGVRCAWDNP